MRPCANPNGATAGWAYNDVMRRQDPARVRDLIRQAPRYGLDVCCPIMDYVDGTAENEVGLRKLVQDVVKESPRSEDTCF